MNKNLLERVRVTHLDLGLVLLSGLIWTAVWFFNKLFLGETWITSGIGLVYLPAGFRLLIILAFGFWGALGIFLFDPLLFFYEFGSGSTAEILVNAFITSFGAYGAVVLFCSLARVSRQLSELRPHHLPMLAVAVSLVTPLLYNLLFLTTKRHGPEEFARNYSAMAAGDFLGCFLVLAGARVLLAGYRAAKQ
jgi:hypothetical protein